MPELPPELAALLAARAAPEREEAWAGFVGRFSPLLLHVARSVARERDVAMDAYAHLLEVLRADDGRRLAQYTTDGGAQFSTWLVVVARRLCVDHLRQRYGRLRGESPADEAARAMRRRLVDLVAVELDGALPLPDPAPGADDALARRQQLAALQAALAELAPRERLLLALRFEDDRPAREIAAMLGYPTPFHVYRAVNALLARLRVALARRGVEGAD